MSEDHQAHKEDKDFLGLPACQVHQEPKEVRGCQVPREAKVYQDQPEELESQDLLDYQE